MASVGGRGWNKAHISSRRHISRLTSVVSVSRSSSSVSVLPSSSGLVVSSPVQVVLALPAANSELGRLDGGSKTKHLMITRFPGVKRTGYAKILGVKRQQAREKHKINEAVTVVTKEVLLGLGESEPNGGE